MSPGRRFLLNRVPVPTWLHDIDELDVMSNFGEQIEWGFAIPWIYQALAKPSGNRPMLQPPHRGDDFWPGALAYWSSLLHLLVYSFGCSRPDRGLKWWYDTGNQPTTADSRCSAKFGTPDGQLDWFAAWLWTSGKACGRSRPIDASNETQVAVDPEWLRQVERSIEDSETPTPYGGGYDPLHLTFHVDGPMQPTRPATNGNVPDAGEHTASLSVDSMTGWYRACSKPALALVRALSPSVSKWSYIRWEASAHVVARLTLACGTQVATVLTWRATDVVPSRSESKFHSQSTEQPSAPRSPAPDHRQYEAPAPAEYQPAAPE